MTKMKPNTLLKRTTLAVMLTSALLSGCSEKSVESHLADARNYASSQQIDAAIVEYKNAIQKAPDAAAPRQSDSPFPRCPRNPLSKHA